MACFLKAPQGSAKGCITFTTPERDNLILKDPKLRASIEQLKRRYLVGLHHNWHDDDFNYDPLFDFSMAGEDDLRERNGIPFPRVGIDACNFSPPAFSRAMLRQPFWDVLNICRAVDFKGIPQFFRAIRTLYDRGQLLRVLFLCSFEPPGEMQETGNLRRYFEEMFTRAERQRFTFMTMDWDYPFPLDLETLAFFYRSCRVFVHPAPIERRCRTAAYAWSSGIPVVGRHNVASILPAEMRRPPYYAAFQNEHELPDAIMAAVDQSDASAAGWDRVSSEFEAAASALRLDAFLHTRAASAGGAASDRPINPTGLDIRLGRHHRLAVGGNRIEQDLTDFCLQALQANDGEIEALLAQNDPEIALAANPFPFEPAGHSRVHEVLSGLSSLAARVCFA